MAFNQPIIKPQILPHLPSRKKDFWEEDQKDDSKTQWSNGGFRVIGTPPCLIQKPREKIAITIACFIDGTASRITNGSNISKMYQSVRAHEGPWPDASVVVPGYLAGPGAQYIHISGKLLGAGSQGILQRAYSTISVRVSQFLKAGYSMPKIDIFGFSRGSAIANELAWEIYKRGIEYPDGTCCCVPRSVNIRFLGIFDTVHSMELPGPNTSTEWHHNIAPIVEKCAHALARDEKRVYFEPTILRAIRGTKTHVDELIFPGVHTDVGGYTGFNENIMKLTRSWMAENAVKAGVSYLDEHIISAAEKKKILSDPANLNPSPDGQRWIPTNLLYHEQRRREFANRMWGKLSDEVKPLLQSGVVLSAFMPGVTSSLAALAVTPGEENFDKQPEEFHLPRRFPSRIEHFDSDPNQITK